MRFADRIEAVGTALANEQVTLSAPVTERITRLNFDDGSYVQRGQIVAVFQQGQQNAQMREALTASCAGASFAKNNTAAAKAARTKGRECTPEPPLTHGLMCNSRPHPQPREQTIANRGKWRQEKGKEQSFFRKIFLTVSVAAGSYGGKSDTTALPAAERSRLAGVFC
jgi:multidrug efflux pump subunit AcrA (membrane-fusion protein)